MAPFLRSLLALTLFFSSIAFSAPTSNSIGHKSHPFKHGHSPSAPTYSYHSHHPGFRSVGYYVNWAIYARNHPPKDIPASNLTHVLYAFADIRESGEVFLTDPWADVEKHWTGDSWNDQGECLHLTRTNVYGNIKQLYLLKKRHRHLKTLLSIGGWTYSSHFVAPAATETGRQTFARSAVRLLLDHGFDGLDVDWEYPENDAQATDYVALLAATRAELTRCANTHNQAPYLLTIAAPAGPEKFNRLKVAEMDRHLDFWNVMGYDFAGSWDSTAGNMANLFPDECHPATTPFYAAASIDHYIACGVAASRLVLGMPLYGRDFCDTDGLGKPFHGVGQGSWERGVWDYKSLPPGGTTHHDAQTIATWSYNATTRHLVSFDGPPTTRRKTDWIRARALGGAMWWETSGDFPAADARSLIRLAADQLRPDGWEDSENHLVYADSKWDNLRAGMRE